MGTISLLDCTLRDGGYLNDWKFGERNIYNIIKDLNKSSVDIIEIGFLKDEFYDSNRVVFNDISQADALIAGESKCKYALMVEASNPFPPERLVSAEKTNIDIVRVMVWKRMLKESYDYCNELVKKGYTICIQPVRVEQYSMGEFEEMIKLFSSLNPMAIYVVDSWGTLTSSELQCYMEMADKYMPSNIALGYHGHNNMTQAFQTAVDLIEKKYVRDIIIDASIFGIGRGAGNLNLELIGNFLNKFYDKKYDIRQMIQIYNDYLSDIYKIIQWGYSLPYFCTSINKCNPNYAHYYKNIKQLSDDVIYDVVELIKEEDRIIFSEEKAETVLKIYQKMVKDEFLK